MIHAFLLSFFVLLAVLLVFMISQTATDVICALTLTCCTSLVVSTHESSHTSQRLFCQIHPSRGGKTRSDTPIFQENGWYTSVQALSLPWYANFISTDSNEFITIRNGSVIFECCRSCFQRFCFECSVCERVLILSCALLSTFWFMHLKMVSVGATSGSFSRAKFLEFAFEFRRVPC